MFAAITAEMRTRALEEEAARSNTGLPSSAPWASRREPPLVTAGPALMSPGSGLCSFERKVLLCREAVTTPGVQASWTRAHTGAGASVRPFDGTVCRAGLLYSSAGRASPEAGT